MEKTPTYDQLKQKVYQLEREVIEYIRKEKELKKKRKLMEYRHVRRTMILIKINEELSKEISELKIADKEKLELLSKKLKERVKELSCLYEITNPKVETNFSLGNVLQTVVDSIPLAIRPSDNTCARLILDHYHEVRTKNFEDTKWKLSQEIKVNNKRVGLLEVCNLKQSDEFQNRNFSDEEKSLIRAMAENIAQVIEHERMEFEINESRDKIANLIIRK